jgi:hypothetical protein
MLTLLLSGCNSSEVFPQNTGALFFPSSIEADRNPPGYFLTYQPVLMRDDNSRDVKDMDFYLVEPFVHLELLHNWEEYIDPTFGLSIMVTDAIIIKDFYRVLPNNSKISLCLFDCYLKEALDSLDSVIVFLNLEEASMKEALFPEREFDLYQFNVMYGYCLPIISDYVNLNVLDIHDETFWLHFFRIDDDTQFISNGESLESIYSKLNCLYEDQMAYQIERYLAFLEDNQNN